MVSRYLSNRRGSASCATTTGAGQPLSADSDSQAGIPNTWSMWPCEYTALFSRWPLHRRSSECTAAAAKELPVSTSTRPSGVANADTLAKEGTNATPSAISVSPPRWLNGWYSLVGTTPRQSRSASPRMSSGMPRGTSRCRATAR